MPLRMLHYVQSVFGPKLVKGNESTWKILLFVSHRIHGTGMFTCKKIWIYSIYIRDLWKMIFTNTNFDDCGDLGWIVRCCNCCLYVLFAVFFVKWVETTHMDGLAFTVGYFLHLEGTPLKMKSWNPKSWRFGSDEFPFQNSWLSGSMSLIFRGGFFNIYFQKQTPQYLCVSLGILAHRTSCSSQDPTSWNGVLPGPT